MTYTKQLTCQALMDSNKHTEKTEAAKNHDSQAALIDSLDRLSAEINILLKKQPESNEVLSDISREATNAYEKLAAFYEKFKNTGICSEIKQGGKK